MKNKFMDCVSVIIANSDERKLGALTRYFSKPAVFYGGDYRVIDFALSNCRNSGFKTAAVFVKQHSNNLQCYLNERKSREYIENIKIIEICDNDEYDENYCEGVFGINRKNAEFIEKLHCENVIVIPGNHISKMNFKNVLDFHKIKNADVTIVTANVKGTGSLHKYGYVKADEDGQVTEIMNDEVKNGGNNPAFTGIYIFKRDKLKKYIDLFSNYGSSFQKTKPLYMKGNVFAYEFDGYWKNIDNVTDLWQSNMDLVGERPEFFIKENDWKIHTPYVFGSPSYIAESAKINNSIVSGNCSVFGTIHNSVISDSIIVREGTEIIDSVIMPNTYIGKNVKICKAIIGSNAMIMDNVEIGAENGISFFTDSEICTGGISLLSPWVYIEKNLKFQKNSHIGVSGNSFYLSETDIVSQNRITCYVGGNL